MLDLARCFTEEAELSLDSVHYDTLEGYDVEMELELQCSDTIEADVMDDETVNVKFIRSLEFEPAGLFSLEVAYNLTLTLSEYGKSIDWEGVDLANELAENGSDIMMNVINKTALLIANLTSTDSGVPIMTPNGMAVN